MPEKKINPKFDSGDIVYVVASSYDYPHQVIGVLVEPNGLMYKCICNDTVNWYYAFELTTEKPEGRSGGTESD